MERSGQQYCTAAGGVLLMVIGMFVVACHLFVCNSPAMRIMEADLCKATLSLGVGGVLIGCGGVAASCASARCWIFLYGLAAHSLVVTNALVGIYLLAAVSSSTSFIDYACVQVQRVANATSPVAFARGEIAEISEVAAQAQAVYDSLRFALSRCRLKSPDALRLDSCPDAEVGSKAWPTTNVSIAKIDVAQLVAHVHESGKWADFEDMFRSAERSYVCGGFCQGDIPLFGAPAGTVNQANKTLTRSACFAPLVLEARSLSALACATIAASFTLSLAPAACVCWLACGTPPKRRSGYVHRLEELEWNPVVHSDEDEDAQSEGLQVGSADSGGGPVEPSEMHPLLK